LGCSKEFSIDKTKVSPSFGTQIVSSRHRTNEPCRGGQEKEADNREEQGKPNGTPHQSNSVASSVIPTDREMDEWLEFLQRWFFAFAGVSSANKINATILAS